MVTGPLRQYLTQLADAVNQQPTFSRFSAGGTPNSYLSGLVGDFAFNMGSASSMSRLWVKIGPETGYSTTSWVAIRILA